MLVYIGLLYPILFYTTENYTDVILFDTCKIRSYKWVYIHFHRVAGPKKNGRLEEGRRVFTGI